MKIDYRILEDLKKIDDDLKESCSRIEEELILYENVEIFAGCSGCAGTQIACVGPTAPPGGAP